MAEFILGDKQRIMLLSLFHVEDELILFDKLSVESLNRIPVTEQMLLRSSQQALDVQVFTLNLGTDVGAEKIIRVRLVLFDHQGIFVVFSHKDTLGTEDVPSATFFLILTELGHRERH